MRAWVAGLALAVVALAAQAQGSRQSTRVCEGEFGTGSGLAGSSIGGTCFLGADTDEERRVQKACRQDSLCRVEASGIAQSGGRFLIKRVVSVRQVVGALRNEPGYVQRVGEHIDGVLAPAASGCDRPGDGTADRVSVLLGGSKGAAVQVHDRYCAILDGEGGDPRDGNFRATLTASCGPVGTPDADLRATGANTVRDLVIVKTGSAVSVDGEALVRCPIRKAYTPVWWIAGNPTFQGRFPN